MEEDERDALTRITVREVDPVALSFHSVFLPSEQNSPLPIILLKKPSRTISTGTARRIFAAPAYSV
jgi:hypothetical protein